ncbi:SAM-dependent methyltransferase [Microbulbifer sp. OS29]|uniref:SAM-dependent methyltransferase n=1 Tax=Microbulbifer okhotskensis TaxID=2926617 RepID=A0A9X2EP60_9GAMM|nr:SAM-dependent methyltransferase [Microbulbifer okhotskensis]MCO1335854.1 SAM-dependent methyltransferase [Microbulbifer okhotskensis]
MAVELNGVVTWGRSFNDYVRMFALDEKDLQKKILGAGDGPACFNADLSKMGGQVLSVDPLYSLPVDEIEAKIKAVEQNLRRQITDDRKEFNFWPLASKEEYFVQKLSAMETFLGDYNDGRSEGRYITGELPLLPFNDRQFELSLSSNFLFLYSDHLSAQFHIDSVAELCRVSDEVRLYPLVDFTGNKSKHLERVIHSIGKMGCLIEIRDVDYRLAVDGGTKMMVVQSP